MAEGEAMEAADLELQRKVLQTQIKAMGRFIRGLKVMKNRETATSISMIAIREKDTEVTVIMRRAHRALDLLLDEEDEDKLLADDDSKAEFDSLVHEAGSMLHDMGSLKKAALLSQTIEKSLQRTKEGGSDGSR